MHSIVDGIVTKTTQTLEPKITSLVDRGLKTALANNASNPASLVENQSYNASSRDSGLNNREIVKGRFVVTILLSRLRGFLDVIILRNDLTCSLNNP